MDTVDTAALLRFSTADRKLTVWRWERRGRSGAHALREYLRRAKDVASVLEKGKRRQLHVVRSGETYQSIAAQHLGDWREWPRIVEANDAEPGAPTTGAVLIIPERR